MVYDLQEEITEGALGKMWNFGDLIANFFTHKDFLPAAEQIPGTLFTPLHLAVSVLCVAAILVLSCWAARKKEERLRRIYGILWALMTCLELVKILWETYGGERAELNLTGNLPLYPCSIFMYAMPFAIWGKGYVRRAACGYVCSLGLLGGAINFVYPANVLSNYSCISFAGMHTLAYHGVLVFCAVTMLRSGYHRYTGITKWWELLIPAVPVLIVSVGANMVNFSPVDADYMFFKLESFFFAPLGAATPDWLSVICVYGIYLLIHALPYIPSYVANRHKIQTG